MLFRSGDGALRTADGDTLRLTRGATVVVPHAAGPAHLDGDVDVLVCRPPNPGNP